MNYLSTNLKRLRDHHGISQELAARRLDIKRSRYSGWESGACEPGIDMLVAVCAMYRVGIATMLTKDLTPLTKEDINRLLKP